MNIINGIAGILNALCICGFFGIIVSRGKKKDFVWPDQLWFWIIGYDLWNFAYTYNSVSDRSMYCGLVLLAACTIPRSSSSAAPTRSIASARLP